MKVSHKIAFLVMFMVVWPLLPLSLQASENSELLRGQTVYVPAYSHIYSGDNEKPFLLTITLSIRNIDMKQSITVTTVDYYETQGNLLKKMLDTSVSLRPLESIRYIIPQKDKTGGSGANFIVEWAADAPVNPPIIETVMIGTQAQQGISFTSRGHAIKTTE